MQQLTIGSMDGRRAPTVPRRPVVCCEQPRPALLLRLPDCGLPFVVIQLQPPNTFNQPKQLQLRDTHLWKGAQIVLETRCRRL
jgi:hypothetical protein